MLGITSSLARGSAKLRTYVKDGLKLYMPYRGADLTKGTQFVGTGSTYFTTNDYIDIDVLEDDISSDTAGAISMWIKPDDGQPSARMTLVALGDTNANEIILFEITTAGLILAKCIDGGTAQWTVDTDVAVWSNAESTWKHICLTQDGIAPVLYVDGLAVAQAFSVTTDKTDWMNTLTGIDNCRIGCDNINSAGNDNFLSGSIKNVAIWSRALTATEVQNVMYKSYGEVSGRLASGLVSWWALDVDYTDYHGDNEGTNYGSTLNTDLYGGDTPVIPRGIDNARTVQADAIGAGSALFDGTDDYVSIADSADLSFGDSSDDSPFSITAWVKMDDATGFWIVEKGVQETAGEYLLGTNNSDHLDFYLYDESSNAFEYTFVNASIMTPLEGQWIHIAATYNGVGGTSANAGQEIYINGVLQTVTRADDGSYVAMENLGGELKIGVQGTIYGEGNICQVGVWSAELTQAQIQSIMEKTYEEFTASEKTNLVSYWALDETIESSGEGASFVFDKVGGTLGSELVTNGDFSSWSGGNPTGWSTVNGEVNEVGSDGSSGTGSAQLVEGGSGATDLRASGVMTSGKTYKLTIDIKVVTSGDLRLSDSSGDFVGGLNSTGIKTYYKVAAGTELQIICNSNTDIVIDDVSLKEVLGNPGKLI